MALLTPSSNAEGPTSSTLQQTLEELRNSNFGDWDEVLKVLRQPLALFGLGVGPKRVKRHSVGGDEPDPTFDQSLAPQLTDEQKACLRPAFLGDVQRVILERIAVDWALVVEEEMKYNGARHSRWSDLLYAWFVAPTRQSETASPFEPIVVTTIQLATLSTLSAFLSSPRATQHESTARALTRIVQMLFSRQAQAYEAASQVELSNPHAESTASHTDMPYPLDLCYIHETLRIQSVDERALSSSVSPQATLRWAQCVRLLFTLPAKISNWSEGQEDLSSMLARPDEARSLQQHDEFGAYLAEQLEQLIGIGTQADSLRVFASRVLRSGTAAPIPLSEASSGHARRDFWSALLRCVLRRCEILAGPHRSDTYVRPISEGLDIVDSEGGVEDQVALYSARWQILLLRTLQRTESQTFLLSLLAWFDVVSCGLGLKRAAPIVQDGPSRGPVPHEEHRDFCSTGKENLRNAIALVIKIFLGLSGTDKPLQHISDLASDSSSSEESSASSDERQRAALPCKRTSRGPARLAPLLIEVVRGTRSARHWSPSLATALASVIQSAGSKVMQRIAKDVLETWSDAKRCQIDLRERELYLTTLLIALPLPSPYDPTFIEGVGAHLSHLDPYIRRLGMLCAELSSHHAAHQQKSKSGDQEAPKTLSFSKSIWEGHGEGREEARVLRKLSAKLREGTESGGSEPHLRAPHVSASEAGRLLGIVFEMRRGCDPLPEPIPDAGQPHRAHSPAQIVSRPKPISRSLPTRVAPASRLQRHDQDSPLGSLLALDSSGTNVRNDSMRRPLIVDLSQTEERDEKVSSSSARQDGLRPAPAHELEEAESSASSSGEDSSASDAGDEERAHLQSTLKGLNLANDADDSTIRAALEAHRRAQKAKETKASGQAEDEEFGMSVPKKKRRRVPVYVNELPPLLRDQDRSANRLALRHAEALVRRKRGWGGEVGESYACGCQVW
ncbi:hypothetical protein IE81DRAFT_41327 [Ceraceosorus guamensis]|uniref:Uncharacterized protein n=1 Tax=Ceraceosorus guamensis TaxID=1522189 RepID=A0A316VS38_9BASI|nr:hypothetical protein IE81DRAFT_41327 [Ceraceosorus guamensis]PWN39223.1 hypothetical protein IE81DRAFT_41327 [Ceraceosorus guamensis]